MRVFVSSVVRGYQEYREAAKDAIEALGYEPVVMESTHPSSPQEACLTEIKDSGVVVLLLGRRYGKPQESGKSPTHEEWDHARGLGKHVLVFIEELDDREETPRAVHRGDRRLGGRCSVDVLLHTQGSLGEGRQSSAQTRLC